MENKKEIQTKQILGFDLFAIAFVFLLPLILIFFSNSKGGTFIGIIFLLFMIYGVVFLYNQLYRKKLIIKNEYLVYENSYYLKSEIQNIDYNDIQKISVEQGLFNKLLNTGKLVVILKDEEEISLINLSNPLKIKETIESHLIKV